MAAVITEENTTTTETDVPIHRDNGHRNSKVRVRLVDHQGRQRHARLPTHLPMGKVKERIIEKLEVSPFDSNGQPIVYDLVHNGKVLTDDDTLESVGVMPDDEVALSPSIQSA